MIVLFYRELLNFEHVAVHYSVVASQLALDFGRNTLMNVQTVYSEVSRTADV